MYHPRDNRLLENARKLRKNMTKEENKLWFCFLRRHRFRFRRQEIIGDYIADFYCKEVKLVIELDGSQHYEHDAVLYDEKRTEYFKTLGISVIRISNMKVNNDFDNVCKYIDIQIANIKNRG